MLIQKLVKIEFTTALIGRSFGDETM